MRRKTARVWLTFLQMAYPAFFLPGDEGGDDERSFSYVYGLWQGLRVRSVRDQARRLGQGLAKLQRLAQLKGLAKLQRLVQLHGLGQPVRDQALRLRPGLEQLQGLWGQPVQDQALRLRPGLAKPQLRGGLSWGTSLSRLKDQTCCELVPAGELPVEALE
jgi:hypothetical protein